MRRNTDIEIPQVRIRIHILCESYVRAQTTAEKSRILNDIESQVFHAADLLAWDMIESRNEQSSLDHAAGSAATADNSRRHSGAVAA